MTNNSAVVVLSPSKLVSSIFTLSTTFLIGSLLPNVDTHIASCPILCNPNFLDNFAETKERLAPESNKMRVNSFLEDAGFIACTDAVWSTIADLVLFGALHSLAVFATALVDGPASLA